MNVEQQVVGVLQSPYVNLVITTFAVVFSKYYAPSLPSKVVNVFNNNVGRAVIMLAYLVANGVSLEQALIVTIVFVVGVELLNRQYPEKFTQKRRLQQEGTFDAAKHYRSVGASGCTDLAKAGGQKCDAANDVGYGTNAAVSRINARERQVAQHYGNNENRKPNSNSNRMNERISQNRSPRQNHSNLPTAGGNYADQFKPQSIRGGNGFPNRAANGRVNRNGGN